MKVGFVGLGNMGGGLAQRLAIGGHDLTVYDVSPQAMAAFEGKASLAGTLAEAAQGSEVVGLCVRDDDQVKECLESLLPAMAADSVLMIHSTVRPATIAAAAERAAQHGVRVLDAPVTRSSYESEGPFVFTMTGGDEDVARRVAPLLESFSTDTLHVGPLGSAVALKISNNLVTWSQVMISVEAFRMAEAAGVPADSLIAVMRGNGALTPTMEKTIEWRRARKDDPEYQSFVESQCGIGEKDLALAEALAAEAGVSAPTATYVRNTVRRIFGDFS